MKTAIIIGMCILLLGCGDYDGYGDDVHPCYAPYTNNISCKLAESCYGHEDFKHIIPYYIEDECSQKK